MTTREGFKKAAQLKKAHKLAHLLLDWEVCSSRIAEIDEEFRRPLAKACDVHPPSQETWDLVVEIVAAVERDRAAHQDPFEALIDDGNPAVWPEN